LAATTALFAAGEGNFTNDKQKASYAIGMSFGSNWKRQDVEVDLDQFMRGIKDAMEGKTALTEKEASEVMDKFRQDLMAKQQEKRKLAGERAKKEGEEFLAANKSKPGVITLTNGLQYKVVTEGTGEIPKPTDTVSVHYRGTFLDGTEFDSSFKRGQPFTTRVSGGIIRGWTEALTRMKTGDKWQLFIPAALAYGEMGNANIPPNSVLIFDVELLSIQPPPPPPAPPAPLTSDIIKVPSAEEMKKGAKIETIKAEDVERMQKEQAEKEKKKP
jgi:FKBP-type peptidyl-prolyl cis-trans isomerase